MPAASSSWTSCGPSYMLRMITRDAGIRLAAGPEAAAVVLDPCVQLVRGHGDSDQHHPRLAVPQRVADRLPDDQEGLVDDHGRGPHLVSADSQPYVGIGGHRVDV